MAIKQKHSQIKYMNCKKIVSDMFKCPSNGERYSMQTMQLQYLPKRQTLLTRKSWNIGEYWKSLINMHGFLYTWKNTITVWNFLECNGYIWLGDRTNVFNIKRHLVLPFWEAVEPFNNSPELFLSALTSQTATWFHSVIGHSPLSCSHTLAINVAFHYLKKKKKWDTE